jgi:hypothetical protein
MLHLLDAVAEHCLQSRDSPEGVLAAFSFVLGGRPRLLEGAAEALDEGAGAVREYRTRETHRAVWKVRSSKDKEYTVT